MDILIRWNTVLKNRAKGAKKGRSAVTRLCVSVISLDILGVRVSGPPFRIGERVTKGSVRSLSSYQGSAFSVLIQICEIDFSQSDREE